MMIAIDHEDQINYSQITEAIFLGTNMCCHDHFAKLATLGISADISIELEHVDKPRGVDYYLWLPVRDFTAPSQNQLKLGATAIDQLVALGEKVYIHCEAGQGRSPTVLAAYFITQGMTTEAALQTIKKKRPVIALTPSQLEALHQFEKTNRRV